MFRRSTPACAQRPGQLGQQVAVGGQGDVLERLGCRATCAPAAPDPGARWARRRSGAPGATPRSTKQRTSCDDLLEAQDVVAVDVADAVLGQAVGAAVVAAIGDRHPQVVDPPVQAIGQRAGGQWRGVVMRGMGVPRERRRAQLGDDVRPARAGSAVPSPAARRRGSLASGTPPRRPMTPAVARESIAAGPTSANDSMRNSSPNPSSVLSKRAASASTVVSRRAMPVPPVSSTTWAPSGAVAAVHDGLDRGRPPRPVRPARSPATRWCDPAAAHSSRISRPPTSVSSVRVSETVRMAIRIAAPEGAACLCSLAVTAGNITQSGRQFPGWAGRAARTRSSAPAETKRVLREQSKRRQSNRSLTVDLPPCCVVCNDVLCPFAHNAVLVEPVIGKIIKEFGGTTAEIAVRDFLTIDGGWVHMNVVRWLR